MFKFVMHSLCWQTSDNKTTNYFINFNCQLTFKLTTKKQKQWLLQLTWNNSQPKKQIFKEKQTKSNKRIVQYLFLFLSLSILQIQRFELTRAVCFAFLPPFSFICCKVKMILLTTNTRTHSTCECASFCRVFFVYFLSLFLSLSVSLWVYCCGIWFKLVFLLHFFF